MTISIENWENYIEKLSKISSTAANKLKKWVEKNGLDDRNALIEYANALVTKYGEGAAELSCQMYDAIAELEGLTLPPAVPVAAPGIDETAKAINGVLKQSPSGQLLESVMQRMVKQMSADTTLENGIRDGASFAWIPHGDTCSFCLTLASRGWQRISRKSLKNGHAEHIHAHCDCNYAVSHNGKANVEGYNPEIYRQMYNSEKGDPNDRINAMRRKAYAANKDKINEQRRKAYAIRMGKEEE